MTGRIGENLILEGIDCRVYARVLRESRLNAGDPVQLLSEDEALIGPR